MIDIAELVLRAEAMGVRVEWGRDLPVPAEYDHARRVIRMADGRGDPRPGDVVVAMASSGLHSNGYSLARHVLLELARERSAASDLDD